jgi:hypothetical protein
MSSTKIEKSNNENLFWMPQNKHYNMTDDALAYKLKNATIQNTATYYVLLETILPRVFI